MLNPEDLLTVTGLYVCVLSLGVLAIEDIRLIGYTTSEIGRWTGSLASIRKMRKLTFMQEVLDGLGVGGG